MKANADVNIKFDKIGLDSDTLNALQVFSEAQAKGAKKIHRFEIDDEAKGVVRGCVAIGVLAIIAYTTTSIFKIIYGTSSS